MDSTLSSRLVQLRERCAGKRGQRIFARSVGIKQQSISNYERGSVPSANVLAKIVMATGCSAEWLLTGRGSMFPDGHDDDANGATLSPVSSLTLTDAKGNPVTIDQIARMLDVSERQASSLLGDLQNQLNGQRHAPFIVRGSDGRLVTLYPRETAERELVSRIRVDVTETEIQIRMPNPLLQAKMLRVIPE